MGEEACAPPRVGAPTKPVRIASTSPDLGFPVPLLPLEHADQKSGLCFRKLATKADKVQKLRS